MAKLGWGTPTLVSVSLGIIIEIPGQHRHRRRAQGRAARRGRGADRHSRSTSSAPSSSTSQRALLLRRRCSSRRVAVHDPRRRDGPAGRVGRRRRTSCCRVGGFHPRSPRRRCRSRRPTRIALSILNDVASRASGSRATSRSRRNTVQFGAQCRARSSASATSASTGTSGSTRCSSSRRSTSSSRLGVGVAQGVRRRAVQRPGCGCRARGPAPWRAHGSGSITLLFFDDRAPTSTSPGARRRTRPCRRSR